MRNSIKVLVVDDDRGSAQLISEVVTRMGLKAVVTAKPADALNVAKLQTVHAAVVDVLLPKMSGVDLATEFRRTKFGENPVILVSGVFKDKAFAGEAIAKSGAVDFLFKPYGAEELMKALQSALAAQLTQEKWNVQSLLTRELKTARERAKAIERLEKIRGLEFPFVLSILTEARISGHLNIVNDNGEIFGVTLSRGTVAEVDSSESQSTGVLSLISNGYLAQEDWDAFQGAGKRKFSLERLIQEGLVSPHAVSFAKREQIIDDLKSIFSSETIQVNFVRQDDVEDANSGLVSMADLLKQISGSLGEFFPTEYLEQFYVPIANSSMLITGSPAQLSAVWRHPTFAPLGQLREAVEHGQTLADALKADPGASAAVYAGLHFLVLNRYVLFEDRARTQDFAKMIERYQKMFSELDGRSPDQVFAYFGGAERLNPVTVERIFTEYKRGNHPDHLPKDSPADLIEICAKCMTLVENARVVMVDDVKRQQLFDSQRVQQDERGKRATELQVKGLDLLRKGQFPVAIETLTEAERQSPSTLTFLIRTWAEVKGGAINSKARLQERVKKIESLTGDDRRSAYFFMALGVCKKALGDQTAVQCFEKVIEMDPSFVEARRELNAAGGAPRGGKADLLTGDLSTVISQLFRRKAE